MSRDHCKDCGHKDTPAYEYPCKNCKSCKVCANFSRDKQVEGSPIMKNLFGVEYKERSYNEVNLDGLINKASTIKEQLQVEKDRLLGIIAKIDAVLGVQQEPVIVQHWDGCKGCGITDRDKSKDPCRDCLEAAPHCHRYLKDAAPYDICGHCVHRHNYGDQEPCESCKSVSPTNFVSIPEE